MRALLESAFGYLLAGLIGLGILGSFDVWKARVRDRPFRVADCHHRCEVKHPHCQLDRDRCKDVCETL